jgi:hypothetical protein
MTWQELRGTLEGCRETIWAWLLAHGPASTTAIAEATGIGLLTVRPRVSELCAWGFAECVGRLHREGEYRAIPVDEAHARHSESCRESQLNLLL